VAQTPSGAHFLYAGTKKKVARMALKMTRAAGRDHDRAVFAWLGPCRWCAMVDLSPGQPDWHTLNHWHRANCKIRFVFSAAGEVIAFQWILLQDTNGDVECEFTYSHNAKDIPLCWDRSKWKPVMPCPCEKHDDV
jgi:hypothetical protein